MDLVQENLAIFKHLVPTKTYNFDEGLHYQIDIRSDHMDLKYLMRQKIGDTENMVSLTEDELSTLVSLKNDFSIFEATLRSSQIYWKKQYIFNELCKSYRILVFFGKKSGWTSARICLYHGHVSKAFEENAIYLDSRGFQNLQEKAEHLLDTMKCFKLQKEMTLHFIELQQLYRQAKESILHDNKNENGKPIAVIRQKADEGLLKIIEDNISYQKMLECLNKDWSKSRTLSYINDWFFEYWVTVLQKFEFLTLYANNFFRSLFQYKWVILNHEIAKSSLPRIYVLQEENNKYNLLKILLIACTFINHTKSEHENTTDIKDILNHAGCDEFIFDIAIID